MADSNKEKNEFKEKRNRWWIWTIVAVVIIFILLLVFGKTSSVGGDDKQPFNPKSEIDVGEGDNENRKRTEDGN